MGQQAVTGYDVVIVGAGFTGLTAAYVLSRQGKKVLVAEADTTPGGLAGTFEYSDGVRLEKFYHHWFNHDAYVYRLVKELGLGDDWIRRPSRTGMYVNGRLWRLATPLDLLRFKVLSLADRIRLGRLLFQVRRIKDWQALESLGVRDWLEPLCGQTVYRLVWEPLITAKFSIYAEAVNAAWMWKKLSLRGGSRNDHGSEEMNYLKGGFGRLAEGMASAIEQAGGEMLFGAKVTGVHTKGQQVLGLDTLKGRIQGRRFLFTPALPIIADIFAGTADPEWLAELRRVRYLGNMCLVLRLDRRLSSTYWTNVNDPGFPFVGVIEHTNFDTPANYRGTHIVYLSRYLALDDPVWVGHDEEYFDLALEHLRRMYPQMARAWVLEYKVWRAEYAQPVPELNYSKYVPGAETPYQNAWISTMAQIYPEDRGTNYAIRQGRDSAERIGQTLHP